MHCDRSRRRKTGQGMVEFGICIVFLVMLTMGLIQYGIIVQTVNALKQIGREGAHNAGLYADDTTNFSYIATSIHNACIGTDVNYSDLTWTVRNSTFKAIDGSGTGTYGPSSSNALSGSPVTLSLTYNLKNKFFLPTSFPGFGSINTNYTIVSSAMAEPT